LLYLVSFHSVKNEEIEQTSDALSSFSISPARAPHRHRTTRVISTVPRSAPQASIDLDDLPTRPSTAGRLLTALQPSSAGRDDDPFTLLIEKLTGFQNAMETKIELMTGRIDQLESKKRQQLTPSTSTNTSPRQLSSLRRRLNNSAEAANFDSAVAANFESAEAGPWGMYYSDDESIPPTMPGPSFASAKAGPFKSDEDYASADVGQFKSDDVGVEEEEEFDPSSSEGEDSNDPTYREEEVSSSAWEEEDEEVDFDGNDESVTEEINEGELGVGHAKFKRGREPEFKLCGKTDK
jgi:hypothetical protein